MTLEYLSLGCHNLTGGSSSRRSERIVRCALDLGICRFDVAPSYGLGTAEGILGKALGRSRKDPRIEVTTKFGVPPPRFGLLMSWMREPYRLLRPAKPSPQLVMPSHNAAITQHASRAGTDLPYEAARLKGCLESSLRTLGVERVAGYLIHESPFCWPAEVVIGDLESLKRSGAVGKIGCSGELANVLSILGAAQGKMDVAQVSLAQVSAIATVAEKRAFNILRLAIALHADKGIAASIADTLHCDDIGACLTATIACAHAWQPSMTILVNASTPERLRAIVEPLSKQGLDQLVERIGNRASTLNTWPTQ